MRLPEGRFQGTVICLRSYRLTEHVDPTQVGKGVEVWHRDPAEISQQGGHGVSEITNALIKVQNRCPQVIPECAGVDLQNDGWSVFAQDLLGTITCSARVSRGSQAMGNT